MAAVEGEGRQPVRSVIASEEDANFLRDRAVATDDEIGAVVIVPNQRISIGVVANVHCSHGLIVSLRSARLLTGNLVTEELVLLVNTARRVQPRR